MQICHQMAKETARENNDEAIEKSVQYYNSKVKPITFKEGELVLLKVQNFLGKNRKLAETFKGPYTVSKVNENGTIRIKTKCAKHDQLVNQNLLIKYNLRKEDEEEQKEEQQNKEETAIPPVKRTYKKRIFESREDGGPTTRSRAKLQPEQHEINENELNCEVKEFNFANFVQHCQFAQNAPTLEAENLITTEKTSIQQNSKKKMYKN